MGANDIYLSYIFELIKSKSGINLTYDKEYLISARLTPLAQKHNFTDYIKLIQHVRETNNPQIIEQIIYAMTTNESSFFRDNTPFKILQEKILPDIIQQSQSNEIKIWCAACSTGQEPYSIAMILKEKFMNCGKNFSIIATDLSMNVLEKARNGIYSQFEVQRGLPITMLLKYFKQHGQEWHVNSDLKQMIKFNQFNLLQTPTFIKAFNIVFCRNVLIYFDSNTKKIVLDNIAKTMKDNSKLFIGSSESMIGLNVGFVQIDQLTPNIYKLKV